MWNRIHDFGEKENIKKLESRAIWQLTTDSNPS
jgi:hypothetical protein